MTTGNKRERGSTREIGQERGHGGEREQERERNDGGIGSVSDRHGATATAAAMAAAVAARVALVTAAAVAAIFAVVVLVRLVPAAHVPVRGVGVFRPTCVPQVRVLLPLWPHHPLFLRLRDFLAHLLLPLVLRAPLLLLVM